jgi:hypothetical protein
MVPHDRFTPHGYLDNPHHTRNLNPSGVVRSGRGIGFGWHFPAYPAGYGFREVYRAGMRLYLVAEGGVRLDLASFPGLVATRHTKNEMTFEWSGDDLELVASWFLVGEDVLACRARVTPQRHGRLALGACAHYRRHLGAAGVWGESGLLARPEEEGLVLQGFEDGEAFALSLDRAAAAGATAALDDSFLRAPSLPGDHVVVTGRRGSSVDLYGALLATAEVGAGEAWTVEVLLARADRRDRALAALGRGRTAVAPALARHRASDAAFWRDAPRLHGDWPDGWARGFAIDLETLRMMVRRPIGIYRHVWDAMQIQAPRVVLAEAAIDALLLSYADLPTAKELLLGTFLDAPRDNVPCSREDGTFNMVAANGSECGTAPEWGYPLRVVDHLFTRDADLAWLGAIYPALERFLTWWRSERSDADGYLVYDNSWESGQDLSARFGPQKQGGGSTIRAVRPVDLQAAMADACARMARFAEALGHDARPWHDRSARHRLRTEALWHDGAYRDHDARVGWSDVWDVMQLSPVALGLAPPERVAALRETILRLADDVYLWPMFVWTAVDAAHRAGVPEVAARIAADTVGRAYAAWDRRSPAADDPLPGVTCEYWGSDGRYGAEGYGWGAFGVHLVFRSLLGYEPLDGGFALRPNLPRGWPDGRYGVTRLHAGTAPIDLILEVRGDAVELTLAARGGRLELADQTATVVRRSLPRGEGVVVRTLPDEAAP